MGCFLSGFRRGVAQLVARDVWDVDAAGSNPVTPMTDAGYAAGKAAEFPLRLQLRSKPRFWYSNAL